MLRRSHSATNNLMKAQAIEAKRHKSLTAIPKLQQQLINTSEDGKSDGLSTIFQEAYGYDARPEQVEAAVHLVNGNTTFLLAGTGFGKSRVPEVFYLAHDRENYAPIVLSINPLDSLGDDQVSEKALVELNAVNLTSENCTKEVCDEILQGKYGFVYVSPEIALTSEIFDQMWCDPRFQARLILMVVDEAHMVYTWGLVESGEAKRLASHARVNDGGVFRPSYGELARRFLILEKIPMLLMSATCTPQAIFAILRNLKLDSRDVKFTRAELARPELRLIRRAFKRPLKASLRCVFAHHSLVPTDAIPPTLVYAGTQNATLDFLQLINLARGDPNEAANGLSDFARRYHATTGPNAKLSAVAAYVAGTLAVICCTLALGLGQNWKRVRRVVIVGRQDPCNFIQMSGRCGRDGRRGLGILLVEHHRVNGKNSISDFKTPTFMSDDDRMDAFAITPVCLRVALAVDLEFGYIPLAVDDWTVRNETHRQTKEGFRSCDCSNCKPEEAEALWLAQQALTTENFDNAMAMSENNLLNLINSQPEPPLPSLTESRPFALVCGADDPIIESQRLETLVTRWEVAFIQFFIERFPTTSDLGPKDYFGRDLAWDLAKNIDVFTSPNDLAIVLASEAILGQFQCLFQVFVQWKDDFRSDDLIADAMARRQAAWRAKGLTKIPQSVEGALISKTRLDAAKAAIKLADDLEKAQAEASKAALKLARALEKEKADAAKAAAKQARILKKANDDTAKAAAKDARALAKAQREAQKGVGPGKRMAEEALGGGPENKK